MNKSATSRAMRLMAIVLLCVVASTPPAPAEDGGFGGFLSHLFGAPAAKTTEPAQGIGSRKPRKKLRDFVPATTTRAAGAPGGAPVQASFFIDVIGDSLGVLASDGLSEAFSDKPEVAVVNKARDASGLVRDDYFDWPKSAIELAAQTGKVDFVVVMLGSNDMQSLREGSDSLEPLSDRWREKYGQRVEALVAPFHAAHIPVAWIGLPPMRKDTFNAQAIKLNDLFKERAERAGARYIDIWDAFADQNGQYDAFGPNIDGQNVKLRGSDGILFTKAGARKVAHFLEAEIRKAIDKNKPASEVAALPPDIEQAADDINAQIRREMGTAAPIGATTQLTAAKSVAGPILSLTAQPISLGGALASRSSAPLAESLEVTRVVRLGEPREAQAGRADDFSWPRM